MLAYKEKAGDCVLALRIKTGEILGRLTDEAVGFGSLNYTFLPDGRHLVAHRAFGHDLIRWDFVGGALQKIPGPRAPDWILTLAVSPDGELLATGDQLNSIQIRMRTDPRAPCRPAGPRR